MKLPVEATLDIKPFQDQKKVWSLLESHGFTVTNLGGDKVRVSGNFKELRDVKIHLEKLMATNTHPHPPMKELASGFASSLDSKETSPPDQQGSVRSRKEAIVVDVDVFSYANQLRKRELEEALKGHVRMHSQKTGESIAITLSGNNSREAGSKLKHFLADLDKNLRTQDVLLSDLSPKGIDLLMKIEKSGNISGSNLVCFMGDRVHIIGPSKESFELKQELLVDHREPRGKPSETDWRKRRSLSLQELPRINPKKNFREVSAPPADKVSGFSSSPRGPADRLHSGNSFERDGRKRRSLSLQELPGKNPKKIFQEVSAPPADKASGFSSSPRAPGDHHHSGKSSERDGRKRRSLSLQERLGKNPQNNFLEVSAPPVDKASGFSSSPRVLAYRHHSGKSSKRDGRKKGSLSMCLPFKKKSRKDVREVFLPPGDKAGGFSSSHKVPADRRHSGSQRVRRSSDTQERTKAEIFEEPKEEVAPPKQRKSFMHRIRSILKKSKRTK
ncbi:hypothetical protein FQA47_021853 [Oryzias melastigma]|uniref:Uncharacterized protein n=1 Tax=Oryzias melastigma TaxID=30732 RepID=A0A834F3K3_ORYME|nr:hypothetical protein FQA47_021853 [Oryzias melastigma]